MPKVDGVDYTAEGIASVRAKMIEYRDASFDQWPEAIEFTTVASHVIVAISRYERAESVNAELLAALEAILPQYMAFIDQGADGIHQQGDREQYLRQHNAALHAGYAAAKRARGED